MYGVDMHIVQVSYFTTLYVVQNAVLIGYYVSVLIISGLVHKRIFCIEEFFAYFIEIFPQGACA